jgi:DNA-binding CsgD family transcriptional regulator
MAQPLQLRSPRIPNWPEPATSNRGSHEPVRVVGPLEAACFEAHPDPQFVFNQEIEIVAANRAARAFLDRVQGPRALAETLVASAGDLVEQVGREISDAIRTRTAAGPIELRLPPPLALSLRVVPLDRAFANALVTLRLQEPAAALTARERFGFTPMESRVAELLSRGLTPSKIAQEFGISIETVRCHLKQAFVKAGVHRQAELVAVMLGA